jgi:hypothetical protein
MSIIKPELIRKPTRREFLKYAGVGALAFGVPLVLKVREAKAAVTYFGYGVNSDGSVNGTPTADGGYGNGFNFSFWADPAWATDSGTYATYFTCPGTGSFDVHDISAYLNATAGTPTLHLGVYDAVTPFALMARGTSSTTMGAGANWYGHQSQAAITQTTALTGGSTYVVLFTSGTSGTYSIHSNSLRSENNVNKINTTSYVGAIPATLPSPTGINAMLMVRIGVQVAGGGGAAPKLRALMGVGQ